MVKLISFEAFDFFNQVKDDLSQAFYLQKDESMGCIYSVESTNFIAVTKQEDKTEFDFKHKNSNTPIINLYRKADFSTTWLTPRLTEGFPHSIYLVKMNMVYMICVPVSLSQFFHMLVCNRRFLLLDNYVGSTTMWKKKYSHSKYLGR